MKKAIKKKKKHTNSERKKSEENHSVIQILTAYKESDLQKKKLNYQ